MELSELTYGIIWLNILINISYFRILYQVENMAKLFFLLISLYFRGEKIHQDFSFPKNFELLIYIMRKKYIKTSLFYQVRQCKLSMSIKENISM